MTAAKLIELWRGGIRESTHLGHVVIADRNGIVEAWGDPGAVIFPRSSCKMIQALPLVESGAADAAGLGPQHLALACASHNGGRIHTSRVETWLTGLGLAESDLRCGAHMPKDPAESRRLICSDTAPCQIHNNCSGKHAGFLTLNRHLGGDAEYVAIDHPVQQAVRNAFEEVTEQISPGWGIDGCSAPNFACTVGGLARAMAGLISASRISFEAPVTMKSSAYRTKLIFAAFPRRVVDGITAWTTFSSPSSTMFASVGEMMPPCGVPASVGKSRPISTYPAFSHLRRISRSMGTFETSQS